MIDDAAQARLEQFKLVARQVATQQQLDIIMRSFAADDAGEVVDAVGHLIHPRLNLKPAVALHPVPVSPPGASLQRRPASKLSHRKPKRK